MASATAPRTPVGSIWCLLFEILFRQVTSMRNSSTVASHPRPLSQSMGYVKSLQSIVNLSEGGYYAIPVAF